MAISHARKHTPGVSGEFLVAGELLRRGIMASVTYGNAKQADVIASSDTRAVSIEVKSTSSSKWVLGAVPEASNRIWVLVHLPIDEALPPRYFVLSSEELRGIVVPEDAAYRANFLGKHGKPFRGRGVSSIARTAIPEAFAGAWGTVRRALELA